MILTFDVTPALAERIESARVGLKLSRSEWIRLACESGLQQANTTRERKAMLSAICRVSRELSRLGWQQDNKEAVQRATEELSRIAEIVERIAQ